MAKLGSCKVAKLDLPILIGSIPLRGAQSTHLPEGERAVVGGTILSTSLNAPNPSSPSDIYMNQPAPQHPSAPPMYGCAPPPYSDVSLPGDYQNVCK